MSACRSCGAAIIWAETSAGKRIPLDAEPVERPTGVFRLVQREERFGAPLAVSAADELVYISHFATCPQADEWRRA